MGVGVGEAKKGGLFLGSPPMRVREEILVESDAEG
jgi:hypothetical protein